MMEYMSVEGEGEGLGGLVGERLLLLEVDLL